MCSKSKIATPARNDSYADDTRAPLMQPAPRGATHDKLTSTGPFCNGLSAFATRFCFCLSPASNGSNVPNGQMSEVARRLKIGRSTLYRKLDEAAADDPAAGSADETN